VPADAGRLSPDRLAHTALVKKGQPEMTTNTIRNLITLSEEDVRTLPGAGPWLTPPWTMEERLRRIESMGQRIHGIVEFMCKIANLEGTCPAAKERAVTIFYERLVIAVRQLGKIQEDIQLS
jgi:hypothetical protein